MYRPTALFIITHEFWLSVIIVSVRFLIIIIGKIVNNFLKSRRADQKMKPIVESNYPFTTGYSPK